MAWASQVDAPFFAETVEGCVYGSFESVKGAITEGTPVAHQPTEADEVLAID
jgi:hypothetical protein